jgi:hypothetical protein
MSHNNIESWSEVVKLNTLESLQDLILKSNDYKKLYLFIVMNEIMCMYNFFRKSIA